ncbi:hypothetical protein C8J55DRAFT_440070 [Lentinula edodes]|uniref:Aminoglycoside phosphotransferase domain-containing protein n=1 Tax=Lentinula lateritia TaxID=40482 RepID=A0A9W8ZSZ9_9AGAR|nr:hypothetical protein C8J55DRAFT_440070 [Lentinula edodes]
MFEETDSISTFSYDSSDEGASPDAFSLSQLAEAVRTVFRIDDCVLVKLAEGGYHKVYEISASDNEIPSSVVRVAALAFPRDKVESEIATLQYIACNTTIHTPLVYAWNTEDDNPVGLEYMILEKIPGVPANEVWETLPFEKKQAVVLEVAEHIIQLFRLRFDTGGSLYRVRGVDQENFHVGPIISTPFYRALDGIIRFPDSPVTGDEIRKYRGPFPDPTSYLRSFLDVELNLVRHDQVRRRRILQYELDNDEERLEHDFPCVWMISDFRT